MISVDVPRIASEFAAAFMRAQDSSDLQYICGIAAELNLLIAPFTETHRALDASIARLAKVRGAR